MYDELERLLSAAFPGPLEARARWAAGLVWALWEGRPVGALVREAEAGPPSPADDRPDAGD